MLTRREILLGGLLTIVWDAGRSCYAAPKRVRQGSGCLLDDSQAEQVFARAGEQQAFITGKEPMISSSGNRDFDYALAHTLSRMTDLMHVLPGFAYYDDHTGENAYATTARRLARVDGTVLFGKRYFLQLMSQPEHPDVEVTSVCAHEFAHIVQFKRGIARSLTRGQRTVKRQELHADLLSGYYAGTRKLDKPDYPAVVFASQAFDAGDEDVNDREHHGTPKERSDAVTRGFEVAYRERRSFDEAIQVGINYVSRL
jgi:predicted metalloprotease